MKVSLCGAGLGAGLGFVEMVELASRQGFDAVDFGVGGAWKATESLGGVEALHGWLNEKNVALGSFGLDIDWRNDDAAFEAGLESLRESSARAGELGATANRVGERWSADPISARR